MISVCSEATDDNGNDDDDEEDYDDAGRGTALILAMSQLSSLRRSQPGRIAQSSAPSTRYTVHSHFMAGCLLIIKT